MFEVSKKYYCLIKLHWKTPSPLTLKSEKALKTLFIIVYHSFAQYLQIYYFALKLHWTFIFGMSYIRNIWANSFLNTLSATTHVFKHTPDVRCYKKEIHDLVSTD